MFGVVVVVVRTVPVPEEFCNRNLIGMKALLCMCGINSPARRYSARLSVSALVAREAGVHAAHEIWVAVLLVGLLERLHDQSADNEYDDLRARWQDDARQ